LPPAFSRERPIHLPNSLRTASPCVWRMVPMRPFYFLISPNLPHK
jgi:hypothetical protein